MAKELPSLGDLELQVLRVVWQEQPCTERTVWEQMLAERDVGRTTVLKTIQRLEAKKLLARQTGPGPVQYRAAVAESRVLPAVVRRFVQGTLAGSLEPLVNYLADSDKLSAKDLAALRAIARKMAADETT
jgi:BlaI family transcriptional regulator, penicillinase repressor